MKGPQPIVSACGVALIAAFGLPAWGDWVEFVDETSARLVAAPDVGSNDVEEKSFAWGDLDRDGDIDLVVARKEPFNTSGKRANVLFLNEVGVLVDRTAEYAVSADVVGDVGFHTPTNDRDVILVDVDQDGWLDAVTATALSDSEPKHIGHPRGPTLQMPVYPSRSPAASNRQRLACARRETTTSTIIQVAMISSPSSSRLSSIRGLAAFISRARSSNRKSGRIGESATAQATATKPIAAGAHQPPRTRQATTHAAAAATYIANHRSESGSLN